MNPAIVNLAGKKMIVPQWIPYTKRAMEEVKRGKLKKSGIKKRIWAIRSSDKKSIYRVEYNGEWTCSCIGFRYRRRCKHIDRLKRRAK